MKAKNKFLVILVVPLPPPYGGIANWYLTLDDYNRVNNTGVKFSVINIAQSKKTIKNKFSNAFFSVVSANKNLILLLGKIVFLRPRAIHITTSVQKGLIRDFFYLLASRVLFQRTIFHFRSERLLDLKKSNKCLFLVAKACIKLSSIVIALDLNSHNLIKTMGPKKRVEIVPNPINITKISSFASSERKNRIVFLGDVKRSKGVEELLEAWLDLHCQVPMWELVLVGTITSNYKEYLYSRFGKCHFKLIGKLDHSSAMKYLGASKIMILPSHTEGFPNVILESMALRVPVIATRVGAITNILHDCGYLIQPNDAEDIKLAIYALTSCDRLQQSYSAKAFQKATRMYSIEKIFKIYRYIWIPEK